MKYKSWAMFLSVIGWIIFILGIFAAIVIGSQKSISPDYLLKMQEYPSLYTGSGAEYTYNYIGGIITFVSCALFGAIFIALGALFDAQNDVIQQNQFIIDKLCKEDESEETYKDTSETLDIFPEGE